MNTYLVGVTIHSGGYEKSSEYLVTAPSQEIAQDYGIWLEAHDQENLDWTEYSASDMGDEFVYTHNGCGVVDERSLMYIKKYFEVYEASIEELRKSGDWSKINEE